jgi:transcriptional regulator with XRE-family HTH domain
MASKVTKEPKPKLPTPEDIAAGRRVAALRERLKLTSQQALADRTDGALERTDVVKIEKDGSKLGSTRVLKGLARAAGVSLDQMSRYIDGEIDLDTLLHTSKSAEASQPAAPAQAIPLRANAGYDEMEAQARLLRPSMPRWVWVAIGSSVPSGQAEHPLVPGLLVELADVYLKYQVGAPVPGAPASPHTSDEGGTDPPEPIAAHTNW